MAFPKQSDSGSCGVFVLMVAHCLAAGRAVSFSQEHIAVVRSRMAIVLFMDDLVFVSGPSGAEPSTLSADEVDVRTDDA